VELQLEGQAEARVQPPGSFTLSHACLSWKDGDVCVLNDICVTVRPGTLVAVCGRVGCGKSSLSECSVPEPCCAGTSGVPIAVQGNLCSK
jgi:ABC-type bacteriocin/lantibiotic exporter with double-glycine peptidase domain